MLYLKLIRFNHWIKNLFIFIPLFFSVELFSVDKFLLTFYTTIGFSFITVLVYIINDVFDIEFDKNHKDKKFRPIASGEISLKSSFVIGLLFFLLGLWIVYSVSINAFFLSIIYFILNFFYSFKLKSIPILDLIIVSIGFIIRVYIGSAVIQISVSNWVMIMVFLLSLFLAICKRRDDVYLYEKKNTINRKVVLHYNLEFMNKIITIVSSVLIVSYLLFITSMENFSSTYLLLTFILVILGILRYNQITYVYNKGGSPIKILFHDIFLQIILICWVTIFFIILYKNQIF